MYIDKELWNKLKESIDNLYWDEDRMSRDGRFFLKEIDKHIYNIENNKSDKVYVITNNSIIDDNINYCIYGVTINKKRAKELFKQAVKAVKHDSDFYNLNAMNINNDNQDMDQEEWYYDENDNSFELYLNGEYNSNNFSIQLLEYDIEHKNEKEMELS